MAKTKPHKAGTEGDLPILIAGGGIGGLTTAIALARHGISSHILERRETFSEAGAGIQLGPNGMRLLRQLGIADIVRPLAGVPDGINIFNGTSGRCLTTLPLGDWIAARHGAPYWVLHRHDLQAALLEVARATAKIKITTGFELCDAKDDGHVVNGIASNGVTVQGRALIGADGIWSHLRKFFFNSPALQPSGNLAARAVVKATEFAVPFSGNTTGVWLSKAAHVVHYPVRGGRDIAIVLILKAQSLAERRAGFNANWDTASDPDDLLSKLGPIAPELMHFLRAVPAWRTWTLYDPPALPHWSKGRVALLGDAAHPVLPFLAQGAVMALEDAHVLAGAIAKDPDNLPAALSTFGARRHARVGRVQNESRKNGRIYHMSAPAVWARDATLRMTDAKRLMQRYDWLYGWRDEE